MKYEYRHIEGPTTNLEAELNALSAQGFRVVRIEYTKGPPDTNGSEGRPEYAAALLERTISA